MKNKSEVFKKELENIKDNNVKESTIYLLNKLPDYFYEMPASTTGKYHPLFSLNEGGLVRHVKVALQICEELFNDKALYDFDEHTKDLIRMAIMLHDGLKKGLEKSEYTKFSHPIDMANFIIENEKNLIISKNDALTVARLISSHMGPWNIDKKSNIVLPIPKEDDEKFVHLCDYLASRRFLDVSFKYNEIERI